LGLRFFGHLVGFGGHGPVGAGGVFRRQRGALDLLGLGQGLFGRAGRRDVDAHFAAHGVVLAVGADLVIVAGAGYGDARRGRKVGLLVLAHLAVACLQGGQRLLLLAAELVAGGIGGRSWAAALGEGREGDIGRRIERLGRTCPAALRKGGVAGAAAGYA